ncbi:MAG: hypothetical protein ACK40Q_10010, partial [Pseudothermotoga sp.]
MTWDLVVIVLLIAGVGFLTFLYIMNTLVAPHRLDSIKTLIDNQKYEQAINALNAILKKDDRNPL